MSNKISGNLAYINIDNIDTDMLVPKEFLKTVTREGLGKVLFYERRYENGKKTGEFPIDKIDDVKVILSGENFGCGSSREHAVWAIKDFGIEAIIAESFADIFYNNCFENQILPIKLDKVEIQKLKNNKTIKIDVDNCLINNLIKFELSEDKRERIIKGLDSIGCTMEKIEEIKDFEKEHKDFGDL